MRREGGVFIVGEGGVITVMGKRRGDGERGGGARGIMPQKGG